MLGSLLFKKLCFGATVGPAIALLLTTPAALRAQLWFYKKVLRKPDDYTIRKALDTEVASIVMLIEIPLAVGLCVPVLVPLACVCCAAHAAAFQCSSVPLKYNSKPSTRYLWASLGLGCALVAWLFYEASLHGYWLVILGPPPIAMCTALAVRSRCREWWLQQARGMKMFGGVAIELEAPLVDYKELERKPGDDPSGQYEPPTLHEHASATDHEATQRTEPLG